MAVIREYYKTREDGVHLYRHYSDMGFVLKQIPTGIEYAEAIDVENAPYTYDETEKFVEVEEEILQ